MTRVIDLTWPLWEGMPNSPAHPVAPKLVSGTMSHKATALWMAKSPRYGQVSFASEQFLLAGHMGTHLDAPWHYFPTSEGKPAQTVDEIPLEECFGPGVVLDLTGHEPGERVGVLAPKGRLETAALLAAWSVGASVVPLDPAKVGALQATLKVAGMKVEARKYAEKSVKTAGLLGLLVWFVTPKILRGLRR